MTAIARAYYWELRKLTAQKRTYLGLASVILAPIAFTVGLRVSPPTLPPPGSEVEIETLYSVAAVASGLAVPLVTMFFSAQILLPLVAALVAGDILAAEDQNRTLKTVLTRSTGRSQFFLAKVSATMTYVLLALALLFAVGLLVGIAVNGVHPVTLGTTTLSAATAARRLLLVFAVYLMPLLAVASIGVLLSTVTRNSAAAVVGTLIAIILLQAVAFLPGISPAIRHWLLSSQFTAWQSVLSAHINIGLVRLTIAAAAAYAVVPLVVAWRYFLRRDVLV